MSTEVKDIKGRVFKIPVDAEHKATECGPAQACMCSEPHIHEFWAATIGFFCTFFSCFAPGALGVYYKRPKPEGLDLTPENLSDGGAFAVTGTILMRVFSGPMCDMIGARKTFAGLLLIGIPGMIIFAFSQDATTFILGRIIIGLSLATFVTCQVWCSQFYAKNIVGTVNATAGGWGNLGGGITLLTMPFIMEVFMGITGRDIGTSWRLCMIVPIVMHLGSTVFILLARDLPDGSYKELEAMGAKKKQKGAGNVAILGFSNTNALIMTVTYGLCFGVELCMNNKLVPYFTRYYAMVPTVAGPLGACFSLMNLFARSWGGILSDYCNKKMGIRGRVMAMWITQTIEGFFCVLMGLVTVSMPGPDEDSYEGGATTAMGEYVTGGVTYSFPVPFDDGKGKSITLGKCASTYAWAPQEAIVDGANVTTGWDPLDLIMIKDPDPLCVHNQGTLGMTMLVMILFSVCVQMAEGLHFGIVPYINRPALGVVSGMVGAGGNAGALISSKYIVGKSKLDEGFVRLGFIIIIGSLSMLLIFFPGEGGAILPKSFPYDPQLVKAAADAKGSDELDFSGVAKEGETKTVSATA